MTSGRFREGRSAAGEPVTAGGRPIRRRMSLIDPLRTDATGRCRACQRLKSESKVRRNRNRENASLMGVMSMGGSLSRGPIQ
jgi:hypothetical protein